MTYIYIYIQYMSVVTVMSGIHTTWLSYCMDFSPDTRRLLAC